MAFPTSPSDGQVYGNHRWDATIGAWIKFPVASQGEAESGTAENVQMVPLRTEQNVADSPHVTGNGSDHADVASNTTHRGSDGSDHSKVGANETAIGLNTTHRGSDGSDHSKVGVNETAIGLNTTHRGLTSGNPHSVDRGDLSIDTDDVVTFLGLLITEDNDVNDHGYVPVVLHGTDATPPAASGFPKGTLYFQYTA